MSNPAQDRNFVAIEAAVRETARGRAFLANYAKKVRQSDILTLLAMMARLERWCEQQSARISDIERRGSHLQGQGTAAMMPDRYQEGCPGLPSGFTASDGTLVSPVWEQNPGEQRAEEIGDPSRELAGRVKHLATTIGELDQKVGDLADGGHALDFHHDLDGPRGDMMRSLQLLQPDSRKQTTSFGGDRQDKTSDDNVLGDIAKALGTAR